MKRSFILSNMVICSREEKGCANIRYSEGGDRDEMNGAQASSRIATVASQRPKHIHMQNNYIRHNKTLLFLERKSLLL